MTYSIAVYGAVAAGFFLIGGRPSVDGHSPSFFRPDPAMTIVSLLIIGFVSTLQLTVFPGLLTHLRRDADAIRGGQVWRLVTAVVTQDGGWVGLIFNLLTLALIGVLAEQLVGHLSWLLAFGVPAIAAELVGLAWQPLGAGNSVGVAGLCGVVVVLAIRAWPSAIPATISLAMWLLQAFQHNVHGAAGLAGVVVGLVLASRAGDGRSRMFVSARGQDESEIS